jgi:hexosaminidase
MANLPPLIPLPASVRETAGEFILTADTVITCPAGLLPVAERLQDMLRPATDLPLRLSLEAGTTTSAIRLGLDEELATEGYRLNASASGVTVTGGSPAGVFYGCQTLRQLLPAQVFRRAAVPDCRWAVPGVEIEDEPKFAWRGLMLDVSRHFMPKHDVLRVIDLLAAHRLNVLHLHLTDDQGWRIEIRRYPRLTEVGSWRRSSQIGEGKQAPQDGRPHGGFYTQDDIREIVAYAKRRFVTVVPEIETPGHAQAAIASYPELGVAGAELETWTKWGINENVFNVEESTIDFLTNVLDEVMELFDSQYIGIGGDECPKTQWQDDPRTQERMRELGVADEEALQSWFIRRLDDHVTAAGRRIFGWDEILEGGLAEGATVASWRGMVGALKAARAGHDVISCPDDQTYLNYRQSDRQDEPVPISIVLTTQDVYAFDPVPAGLTEEEAAHVLGGQANMWTVQMDSARVVDYFVFPRLCAFSEAVWSAEKEWNGFAKRLEGHLARLDAFGVEYRHASGPMPWQTRPGIVGRPTSRKERAAYFDRVTANIVES